MKYEPGCIEFNNGVILSYWQALSEIWKTHKFNWSTFQLINIEIENDRAMQGIEFSMSLLCCGFRIRVPLHPKVEHKIHKKTFKALRRIEQSCYGYTVERSYTAFRKAETNLLIISREPRKGMGRMKKLYLQ